MFSGIIEELGRIKKISKQGSITLFEIQANKVLEETKVGDSIAVNGACLTVVKKDIDTLSFEVIPETIKITNLGSLKISDKVNLERSLRIGDRLSGHFVAGHIDCIGIIRKKNYINGNLGFEIAVHAGLMQYYLSKGSIAVDGISLTVASKKSNSFVVYIIPHTLENTTLGLKGPSDKVNIEFDILAKLQNSIKIKALQ
jgi:riboflavin synthase